jgi:hypothetical protein
VLILSLAACLLPCAREARGQDGVEPRMAEMAEADWAEQETLRGRTPDAPDAVRDAFARAVRLAEDLARLPSPPDIAADVAALAALHADVDRAAALGADARAALYREVRWLGRTMALKNPLVAGKPLAFMKRRRFVCQMLHEYVAYFDDYGGVLGGGVYVLERPGLSMATRDLIGGTLPPGCFTTLTVSYDGRRIYFSHAECNGRPVPYGSLKQPFYQIFDVDPEGREIRQLTRTRDDNFDPCPLPGGDIVFMSTRRGGFTRCNNPWEPIPVYTLHRMTAEGEDVRTLSFHETNEWHPGVLNDGRIVYTRWDYVDRSAANFHGLWMTNPDGTAPVSLFGNYTTRINACFQAKAIPGSDRVLFVAGAHHADVGGSLCILDPARVGLDPETGEDRFDAIERLTPDVPFPEGSGPDGGWPKEYYHSPWPLSENYFLVSYGRGPLPGMSSGGKRDTTALYLMDRWGNLELLYRDRRIACMYPVPLAPRAVPPVVVAQGDAALGDEGEFILTDVRRSVFALPEDRPIRALRIFQVLPKTTPTANEPRIGHANAEGARLLLGTVPVEADGSAYFRAPARRPIYFQAVDERGRAVQSMRSVTYLQPGERRGCIGCHEPQGAAAPPPADARCMATARPPSQLAPGPDGTQPMSFARLVQPVLDRHCVRCHDGAQGPDKAPFALTGEADGPFSRAYQNLRPFVKWFEWGGESIAGTVTIPGRIGADESRLAGVLAGEKHAARLRLPADDMSRLILWLDANAPFYGAYLPAARDAQRAGEAVGLPDVQ